MNCAFYPYHAIQGEGGQPCSESFAKEPSSKYPPKKKKPFWASKRLSESMQESRYPQALNCLINFSRILYCFACGEPSYFVIFSAI